jgi:hypothetical protein
MGLKYLEKMLYKPRVTHVRVLKRYMTYCVQQKHKNIH